MTAEETIVSLEAQLKQALEQLGQVTEQLRRAQARIAELEKLKTPAPAFVNAKKKTPEEEQKKPRPKREAQYNQARRRASPTQIIAHRLLTCPECDLRLGGIRLACLREVIDVPAPPPVEITHHRIYKGWCTRCHKWHEAPVDLQEQVLGKGRLGLQLWMRPRQASEPVRRCKLLRQVGERMGRTGLASFRHLDSPEAQSLPPMPGYALSKIFLGSTLNSYWP